MSFQIRPVESKRDLEAFLRVPYRVYAQDPHQVFPLLAEQRKFFDPRVNPFYAHARTRLWVAERDGRAVARIAACVDDYHVSHWREQAGFAGFYECPRDAALSRALFDQAAGWLREQGMTVMRGPCNFTTNHDNVGLLIDGEASPPVVGMPYNPPYYREQFEEYGFQKAKDLWAWRIRAEGMQIPARLQASIESLLASGAFRVRPIDMSRFDAEASAIREVYNAAWSRNWGFIPMDDAEFAYAAKDMKKMVAADFLLVAEAQGKIIGFALTIPDFNQALKPCRGRLFPFGLFRFLWRKSRIDYARTLLLGVLPEFRGRGIDAVIIYKTFQAGFAHGITAGECSWILEDNVAMNRILEGIGAKIYKTYRVYDRALA